MTSKIIWYKSTFILQCDQVSCENLSEILKSYDSNKNDLFVSVRDLVMKCVNKRINGRVCKSYPENVKVKLRRSGKFLKINVSILFFFSLFSNHDSHKWHPNEERKPTDKEGPHQKTKAQGCSCLFANFSAFTSVLFRTVV